MTLRYRFESVIFKCVNSVEELDKIIEDIKDVLVNCEFTFNIDGEYIKETHYILNIIKVMLTDFMKKKKTDFVGIIENELKHNPKLIDQELYYALKEGLISLPYHSEIKNDTAIRYSIDLIEAFRFVMEGFILGEPND